FQQGSRRRPKALCQPLVADRYPGILGPSAQARIGQFPVFQHAEHQRLDKGTATQLAFPLVEGGSPAQFISHRPQYPLHTFTDLWYSRHQVPPGSIASLSLILPEGAFFV